MYEFAFKAANNKKTTLFRYRLNVRGLANTYIYIHLASRLEETWKSSGGTLNSSRGRDQSGRMLMIMRKAKGKGYTTRINLKRVMEIKQRQ